MWKWVRSLGSIISPEVILPPDTLTVVVENTTHCVVSRLGSSIDLIMTMTGRVEETGEIAQVKITLNDPNSLRELATMLATVIPKLEPPYYGPEDVEPLWDDEHENILDDVKELFGEQTEEWLNAPNVYFGLQTPQQIIDAGKDYWVRESLRSIKIGVFS